MKSIILALVLAFIVGVIASTFFQLIILIVLTISIAPVLSPGEQNFVLTAGAKWTRNFQCWDLYDDHKITGINIQCILNYPQLK